MPYYANDTICAISSASGGAARGLVRLSGANAIAIASKLFRAEDDAGLDTGSAAIAKTGSVRLPRDIGTSCPDFSSQHASDLKAPCELFIWPTHRSYTREPVVEFHTLGSPPILQALLAASCQAGARLAERGEFTLRAFLAGRIDLTQAEAVLAVIDSPDRHSLCEALSQLAGGLARPLDQARNDLVQLLAELEAGLDFVEEDIRFISEAEIVSRLKCLRDVLDEVERQLNSRNTERKLPQVVLVGPPNAGKSSLFNALANRFGHPSDSLQEHFVPALVSPHSGTTRDYLSALITTGGAAFELLDTAGLEPDTPSHSREIAASVQSLTADRRRQASVRLYCVEASQRIGNALSNDHNIPTDCDVVVVTKDDACETKHSSSLSPVDRSGFLLVTTSSTNGTGLDELCAAIQSVLHGAGSKQNAGATSLTYARCRESIGRAAAAVRLAIDAAQHSAGDELVAAELRVCLTELGKVVGAVYTEDLLDHIFKTFCIGK
ncbi:MAG TPA: GTPase [Lacipirellulaceae bacterium]|jgi:tRNA modification GTPase|nr:GTPase [Lacipirellulaceae bacterium]